MNWFWLAYYPLKTGIPVEEGDSILKLLRRVSRPEIQLGVVFYFCMIYGPKSALDFPVELVDGDSPYTFNDYSPECIS